MPVARKKAVPPAGSRPNPLQRMFGTWLRVTRKELSLDSDFAARALDLTETYYRLVESGRATFNPNLAFRLIALLGSRTGPAAAQIHFQRLALYLVGAQWVSAEMTHLEAAKRADLAAVEALAARDADFELFHMRTKGYYALREGDETQRQFLEDTAAPCVANFLATVDYARPAKDAIVELVMPAEKLLALPTLNVEMITRLLEDLSGRPFVHTAHLAAAWEDRTSPLIRSVHGIYKDPELILSKENLRNFHYQYLLQPRFQQLRFVFLEPVNAKSAKAAFVRTLNQEREAVDLERLEDRHVQKIRFVALTDQQVELHRERLTRFRSGTTPDGQSGVYEAYWSFDTATDIPIGFVGRKGTGTGDIWNLSLAE
jgi:hypothetical protein